jgi:hypothetical protein
MSAIDPASVFVGRPIFDRSTPGHDRGMLDLIADQNIGAQYDHVGESSISSARDYVAHYFLTRTQCDWLVWIDSDITFSRQDWAYLMEQNGDELAVCAEYLKKTQDLSLEVANFGLGFARVHRSVYERLDEMTREEGAPRLLRYRAGVLLNGARSMEEMTEYHPIGVHPDGSRRNEDHGFWLMVRLAGIPIRVETRTRLGHTGNFTWWYDKEKIDAAKARRGAQ